MPAFCSGCKSPMAKGATDMVRFNARNEHGTATRRGFTLIELLVVIAIIALLISLLLPALGKARIAGWIIVSTSNARQATVASLTYRESSKGYLPITPFGPCTSLSTAARPGSLQYTGNSTQITALCSWSFAGANPSAFWAPTGRPPGAAAPASPYFDVHASERPLNPFLYGDVNFSSAPTRLTGGFWRTECRAQGPARTRPSGPGRQDRPSAALGQHRRRAELGKHGRTPLLLQGRRHELSIQPEVVRTVVLGRRARRHAAIWQGVPQGVRSLKALRHV